MSDDNVTPIRHHHPIRKVTAFVLIGYVIALGIYAVIIGGIALILAAIVRHLF